MEMNERVPVHVSMIMDGNGRWAQERGKERIYGHAEGVESVRACLEAAVEFGIKYLSVFAFSEENWGRPQAEVDYLMATMIRCMEAELPTFMKNDVRFLVRGNREHLSAEVNATIDRCEAETAGNKTLSFVMFLSYSGKWDILQAARKMALELVEHPERKEDMMAMTEEGFSGYLATAGIPDPDLIIRTSGEKRISNYLLWQSAYSEFLFTDTLWPDFRKEEFRKALEIYAKRDRRYGKVK